MTAQEIQLGYEAELLRRFEVAETILAFQFWKPSGFEFRPGQSSDLTLVILRKPTRTEMFERF